MAFRCTGDSKCKNHSFERSDINYYHSTQFHNSNHSQSTRHRPTPNDKVIRRASATDYREPDIYPPVPENLQKIPSNIAQLIVRPIPLHHRRNASQPRNCALFAFGRFPEAMWSFCVFVSDQLIDYTNNCRCQGPWVENSMLDSSAQR